MIKHSMIITPLLLFTPVFNVDASEWTGYDKHLHLTYGAAIGGAGVVALNFMEYDGNRPLTSALACSFIAGVGKEIYDEIDYGGFDYKDAVVTATGCFVSSYLTHKFLNYGVGVGVSQDNVQLNYTMKF